MKQFGFIVYTKEAIMANLLEKLYAEKQAEALQRISTYLDKEEKKPARQLKMPQPEAPSVAYLFGNAIARSSSLESEPFPHVIRASADPFVDRGRGGPATRFFKHQREVKGF
jgi:hypothetical protein